MAYGGNGAASMATMMPAGSMPSTVPSAADMIPPKPKCGSQPGGPKKEYDLALHVVGLFLVLAASCFGAGFPVVAKKFKKLKIPPTIFFFCKHFGTGVLIATAFVHLLPTAFQSLNDPCLPDLFTVKYPALPGVIGLGSLFTLFAIEMWMHAKMPGGHSHGSATGQEFSGGAMPPLASASARGPVVTQAMTREDQSPYLDEKKVSDETFLDLGYLEMQPDSEMPPWFIAFYEQYVRQRDQMMAMVKHYAPTLPPNYRNSLSPRSQAEIDSYEADTEKQLGVVELEYENVDPMVYKKMAMEITLLEGGILFHSVFVGMTVSITIDGFVVLLIAILFHQTFEGLGLGSRIAQVPYPKGSIKPWLLVFAFGTTAPIGQAIGLITRNSYDPNSAFALVLVGTFNAISSGLLIWAGLVDLLAKDFLSEEADAALTNKKKMTAFAYVLMGAAGMSIVGAFA